MNSKANLRTCASRLAPGSSPAPEHQGRNTMSKSTASTLAYELLGPVTHYYLTQLDHHMRQLDDGDTRFLFVSRAGVRIRKLYEAFLETSGRTPPAGMETFWVSRLLLAKGAYNRSPVKAIEAISRELTRYPLSKTIPFIFAAEVAHGSMEAPASWEELPQVSLREFVESDDVEAKHLVEYLSDQSAMFEEYLADTMAHANRGVLIDSGWQGTGQAMLADHFPEYDWFGLYFGRQATNRAIPPKLKSNMVGLVFESDNYDPTVPETAISLHRHIIESLFEPNAPSIERLTRIDGKVEAPESALILEDPVDLDQDAHYHAVMRYLTDQAGTLGVAAVLRRH